MRTLFSKFLKSIKDADVILEVLDSRDPLGTRCIKLEKILKNKRIILVLNKGDLVPFEVLKRWKKALEDKYPVVFISAKKRLGLSRLWNILRKYKNSKKMIKVAVIGYPNVGKSTIINILKGKYSASTSPVAGWTKHIQLFRATRWLRVLDTPGIISVNEKYMVNTGFILSPKALKNPILYAIKLLNIGLKKDPDIIKKTYNIDEKDPEKILSILAIRRGFLGKGGKVIIDEAARTIIRDWYNGKLVFYFKPE